MHDKRKENFRNWFDPLLQFYSNTLKNSLLGTNFILKKREFEQFEKGKRSSRADQEGVFLFVPTQ